MTKRDIYRILLFLAIPLPLLYLGNYIIDEGLRKSQNKYFGVWNEIRAGGINADVLVMGASRAWVHISPKILDSTLQMNSYNLGLDNWCFLMQYCRLKVFLEHNPKPKYIVHSLDYLMFEKNKELYGDVQFLPYMNDPTISRATEGYTGSFNKLQRYVPMYKYRNNSEFMIEGIANFVGLPGNKSQKYKGYEGMVKEWDSTFADFVHQNPDGYKVQLDSVVIQEFENYLAFCRSNKIKVILTYTPEYYRAQQITRNRSEEFALYHYFAKKYDCVLLDYSSDSLCYNNNYFYNSQHLNKQGSEIFSRKLAQDLKPFLTKPLNLAGKN